MRFLHRKLLTSLAAVVVMLVLSSMHAIAGVHLSATGNWSKNHLGLETHTSQMVKGGINFDIGPYMRLGYSYAEAQQHREGYLDDSDDDDDTTHEYVAFKQDVFQYTHTVDLFAILYAGDVFTPYIFAGIGMKSYRIIYERADRARKESETPFIPFPNLGCGLSIALNKSFSLKVSHTWSMGQTENIDGTVEKKRDTQLDAGIQFSIQ